MRQGNKRRMSPGVGYIGFGNKTSVFTRKPRIPFKKIKGIYDIELETKESKKSAGNRTFKELTEKEKIEIRKRVRIKMQKERKKDIMFGIIAILITAGIVLGLWRFISQDY